MDPYLEGDLWQEFHETLAHQIRGQLMTVLPANYAALLKRHYVIDYSGVGIVDRPANRAIYPDAHVTKVKEAVVDYETMTAPTVELITPLPEKTSTLSVEIREVPGRRLVTVIEILSPANKQGKGFEEYVEKRTALLQTSVHLLELDLLRLGKRIPLVGGELPAAPYYIFLSRATRHPHTAVWPVQLREPLPIVPVPPLAPDPDVPLALQQAIDACFQTVRYHERLLDYTQPPPGPPFSPKDLAWVETILTQYSADKGEVARDS